MLPPKPEQEQVVRHIESETLGLNTAIARTEREIALMQEYRTRLTADVVTGKLDVRPTVADLRDIAPEAVAEPEESPDTEERDPEL